ncbi:MAG: glycogen/starch synthase [Chloroflexota bacterium]|nr:glycogen/starch synthase [Chloroflexota bacterium]
MVKQIKVLFVAAEVAPLVKVGGLGDVAGSLPYALKSLSPEDNGGHTVDIRLVLPFHAVLRKKISDPKFLFSFNVPTKNEPINAKVFYTQINEIPTYLIAGKPIDNAPLVYSSDANIDGYKYTFFSMAILPLIKELQWCPDILHANDWHTALAVYDLKKKKTSDSYFKDIQSILTVHNLPFMGAGTDAAFDAFGIPPSRYPRVPGWGRKFPLPLGLQTADRISTVSPTYAKEMMTPQYGCGLEKLLQTRKKVVSGIVNGLDQESWNPATDPQIPTNFDTLSLSKRNQNRHALIKEFKLNPDPSIPLLILISRMDQQKGVDLAVEGLTGVIKKKWQAILLGSGNPELEASCLELAEEYPNKIRTVIRFDAALARRMYAGGDILLMPSRYEPCGLAQMMGMRYGCVPLARATGGLKDTIVDVVKSPKKGTGFLFGPAKANAFAKAVKSSLNIYKNQDQWKQMQIRGMNQDFSWKRSALNYIDLYLRVLGKNFTSSN